MRDSSRVRERLETLKRKHEGGDALDLGPSIGPSADLLEQLPPASGLARNTGLSTSTTADDSVQATVPHPLHTPSSKPCGVGRTSFDLVRDAQLAAAVEGKEDSIWSPFSDVDDWEFARWIVQTIGHNATQALLKHRGFDLEDRARRPWVCKQGSPLSPYRRTACWAELDRDTRSLKGCTVILKALSGRLTRCTQMRTE